MPIETWRVRVGIGFTTLLFSGVVACTHDPAPQPNGFGIGERLSFGWCNASPADVSCDDLEDLAPSEAVIQAVARGDVDNDGDEDIVVVLEQGGVRAQASPRHLLLLRRDEHHRLSKALSNPNAIPCSKCGGMMGDPLQDIRIEPGEVVFRFEGGSRELWSSQYRFEYGRARDLWLMTSIVHGGLDRTHGTSAEKRLTPTEFGEVSMATFSTEDYPADALP